MTQNHVRNYFGNKQRTSMYRAFATLLTALSLHTTNAFVTQILPSTETTGGFNHVGVAPLQQAADDCDRSITTDQKIQSKGPSFPTRRELMVASRNSAFLLVTTLLETPEAVAADVIAMGTDAKHPIVILGAGGKCGKLCTKILSEKGLYVRATTRDGRTVLPEESSFVTNMACDITDEQMVKQAISGASGVIFAASASGKAKGGVPRDVDYIGAKNTAAACILQKVPKLVFLSAGTVTRPTSSGFKSTNYFVKNVYGEKIMDYKIAGESAVRDLYAEKGGKGQAYTIIRPGGLNGRPSKGSTKLHVSQGDVYSSEISREDVALVTVEALLKGSSTDFATFELNQVGGLIKCLTSLPDSPPELIHAGAPTFSELLDGLFTDSEMKTKYATTVSDFRGDIP